MFGLGHFFYPWGFLVQGLAIVHFIRRRPENYWFYVIFFLGPPGAAIYILAEVLPDMGLLRGFFQGFGRRSRVKIVETQIIDNPSPANYEELGELYKDLGQFEKAREAFNDRWRPEIRLLPGDGIASLRVRENGAIGTRGSAIRGGHADIDHSGDAVQLCEFSEDREPMRRVARVGAEVAGQEADIAAVHAEARAVVVPKGKGVAEGTG